MFRNKFLIFKNYRFEFKHLFVLLMVMVSFQIIVSYIHKTSLEKLLYNTQDWYQLDSAERLANLTATSLELLLETTIGQHSIKDAKEIIQAFNIILSQQTLEHDVEEICLMIEDGKDIHVIDNGSVLYSFYFAGNKNIPAPEIDRSDCLALYKKYRDTLISTERTISIQEE